jgi:hypothetical protein
MMRRLAIGLCLCGLLCGLGALCPAGAFAADGTTVALAGSRAKAATFSVPVPRGFELFQEAEHSAIYGRGGIVLGQSDPPKLPKPFRASIVIAPLPNKGIDPKDPLLCHSLSADAAKSLGGTVLGVKQVPRTIAPGKAGYSCQVLVQPKRDKNPSKLSRAEVVGGPGQVWMVTCSYDKRDLAALSGCEEVTAGFNAAVDAG